MIHIRIPKKRHEAMLATLVASAMIASHFSSSVPREEEIDLDAEPYKDRPDRRRKPKTEDEKEEKK